MNSLDIGKLNIRAYLVGAYLFSVPTFSYSDSLGLLYIPQLLGAGLVAFALLDIIGSLRISIPVEVRLYGMLGLWIIITFSFVSDPSEEAIKGLQTLYKVVLATLACAQLIKDKSDFLIALKMFVFSMILVYFLNIDDLRYLSIADKIGETDRFAGTLSNANTAAIFAFSVIWAAVFLLLYMRRIRFLSIPLVITAAISVLIIYYSGSKKGLIGLGLFVLFIGRIIYLRQRQSFYRKLIVIIMSIALIIIVGYIIYTSPFFFRMEELVSGTSESDSKRYQMIIEAVNVWLSNFRTFIMGVGHDNFRAYNSFHDYSHSTPFELLASNGIVGFLIFLGFIVLLYRKFIGLYRKAPSKELRSMSLMILIYLVIYSLFTLGAVLYVSRELLPLMGCLSAFGTSQISTISGKKLGNS